MTRDELQKLAAYRLLKESRLICQWATGTGKSGIVLQFLKANPEFTCLILVPEQNNIENWQTEFSKFGVPMELVRISCYASLHKYENTFWDLVVFDEAPHVDTEKRRTICESISAKYVLALGAVIDDDEQFALENTYGHFYKWEIPLKKAIEWGILPAPSIRILHMSMDNTTKKYWSSGHRYTALEMYGRIQQKVDSTVSAYNLSPNKFTQQQMFRAGNERKRFLGKLKDEAVMKIVSRLEEKNRRFLCFCASIKQAEEIGKEKAFTSKTPASMKLLDKFNNHEINSLFVVGKLIEGQTLVDIECGVITQLGGTSRITVQEVGRIMRSQNPIIYIPVFDGTKDDSFLYTVTSNIPEEYVSHYKF